MKRTLLLVACVISFITAPAWAQINYSGPSRQISAEGAFSGCVGCSVDVEQSNALGLWSEVAEAFYSDMNGFGEARTSITSNLDASEMSLAGDFSADAGGDGYFGRGISMLTTTFSLDSDRYYLSQLSSSGATEVVTFAFVTSPGGFPVTSDPNSQGILTSGSYSLSVLFRVTPAGEGEYSYRLTIVPEPASALLVALCVWPACCRGAGRTSVAKVC